MIVWQVLFKSEENLHSKKFQICNSHFYHVIGNGAFSILKWSKFLVIVLGFTNVSLLARSLARYYKELWEDLFFSCLLKVAFHSDSN